MFESKVIRIMVYIIGFYTLFAAVQQIISTNIFGYSNWVLNAVGDPALANTIMTAAIPVAILIITAAYFNRRKILLWALGTSFTYQLGAVIINAVDTVGLGSPSMPALFIGLMAALLWAYFRVQPNGLEMEKITDNSIEGVKIIQEDEDGLESEIREV